MKTNNIWHSELLWGIVLSLLIPIWIGVAPVWYEWYSVSENGLWLKGLYGLLNNRWLVNVPFIIVLCYFTFKWCKMIWKDNNLRLYRPIICALFIVVLFVRSNVDYAYIVGCLDYRIGLTVLLLAAILTMIIKVIRIIKKNQKEKKVRAFDNNVETDVIKGFSDDSTGKEDIPESLKRYAGEIVERLLRTSIKDHSYALGVTGEWGVGKTTFLGVLKDWISDRAEVVDFNPWMCSSPEQVTNDFFASLRHQLSPKYSTLSKSIKDYAKYLNNVTLSHTSVVSLEMMLQVKQESLFERKKELSNKFAQLPRPVVVVIDDVDRLERDEVFEVLRLIRNTADLSNVIYLVAYDKEYVTCVLEEKNIKDSSAYLEKIFPVEVHLPKVEEHLVWETLYSEIDNQSKEGSVFAQSLFKSLYSDDKELVLRILDNYRRAKRFARLYVLNVGYISQQAEGELKLLDVFWLELLQMYDKRTYDVLSEDSGRLLYLDGDRIKIKDGILRKATDVDKNVFKGEPFWREHTPSILEKMFGSYVKTKPQSICFAENYEKFFTYSVSPFRLSIKEMSIIFKEGAKADAIVGKWIDDGKYFNSIIYQFKQINANQLNDSQLNSYLLGILGFYMKVAPYRYNHAWEVKRLLRKERYANGVDQKAHDIVMGWFNGMLRNDKSLTYLSKLLNGLYVTIVFNPEGHQEPINELIISNDEVETLLIQVMKAFLSNHPDITSLDLINENGTLPYIFRNCCVSVKDARATEDYCEYKQVAFDTVIAHFEQKDTKPTFEEYRKAINGLFAEETPIFDNPIDEDMYWDFASDAYKNKMQEYFGSSYDSKGQNKLEEFMNKCFVDNILENIEEK